MDTPPRAEVLLELAFAAGASLDMLAMFDQALPVYARHLGTAHLAVVEPQGNGWHVVASWRSPDDGQPNADVQALEQTALQHLRQSTPAHGLPPLEAVLHWKVGRAHLYALRLGELGRLVLVRTQALPPAWLTALRPVLQQLEHAWAAARLYQEQLTTEAALYHAQEQLHLAIKGSGVGLWDWHIPSGKHLVNERWAQMLGYTEEEVNHAETDFWSSITHPLDRPRIAQALQQHFDGESDRYVCELRLKHRNGDWVWLLDQGQVVEWQTDGQYPPRPVRMVGTHTDISAQKKLESRLQLAASVFSHAREGIMITRADGEIVDVNNALVDITGYRREELLGQTPGMLKSGRQDRHFYETLWSALKERGQWTGEIWNRRKSGEFYAAMLTISSVFNEAQEFQYYVALFSDISRLKENERRLENIAYHDSLTGLPNRVLLSDRLQQAMLRAERTQRPLAVIFLDLDGFKAINDRHGHEAGDTLLVAVAQRMRQALREGDTVARIGGDEFVVVLQDLQDREAYHPLLVRLLEAAHQPVLNGDTELQVSASLGVTFYPQDQDISAEQLFRQADYAMYQAKMAGKNRHRIFDPQQTLPEAD